MHHIDYCIFEAFSFQTLNISSEISMTLVLLEVCHLGYNYIFPILTHCYVQNMNVV